MDEDRDDALEPADVEGRLFATVAIIAAAVLLAMLPKRVANHPVWLVPSVAVVLAVVLLLASRDPGHAGDTRHRRLRIVSLVLIALLSLANAVSGARLVIDLAEGEGIHTPKTLLLTGGAIWLINVIVFALWYWELDRGGRVCRAYGADDHDFLFPQWTAPERFRLDSWEPEFVDYLYLSFTNATAFSPTDVMPLSRWAKLTMMLESALSIVIVVLVVARAVNILG